MVKHGNTHLDPDVLRRIEAEEQPDYEAEPEKIELEEKLEDEK